MVVEVEKKIIVPCDFLAELGDRLEEAGYRLVWSGVEEDFYYDHPCRDFALSDEALRVRVSRGRVEVTYKGPKRRPDVKVREELTIGVGGDVGGVRAVLERLGFRVVARVRKRRSVYRGGPNGAVGVFLDRVDCLGCFVEVEVLSVDDSYSRVLDVIDGVVGGLGLSGFDSTVKSYLELVLERGEC